MSNKLILRTLAITLAGACALQPDEGPFEEDAQLAEYRRAIPTRAQLQAGTAEATTSSLLGQPADMPQASAGLILGISEREINLITLSLLYRPGFNVSKKIDI